MNCLLDHRRRTVTDREGEESTRGRIRSREDDGNLNESGRRLRTSHGRSRGIGRDTNLASQRFVAAGVVMRGQGARRPQGQREA